MPTIRFTDAGVGAIRPPADQAQVTYSDARYPGLLLKVGKGGTKTWAYRSPKRTAAGRRPWAKIGRYPGVSYKEALRRFREEEERTENGTPRPELKDRIRELEAELVALKRQARLLTFEDLVDEYYRRRLVKLKEPRHNLRILERDAVRVWRGRSADEIQREDVQDLLDEVVERAPVQANSLLKVIKALYNWAIKTGRLQANPAATVEPPTVEEERERHLTHREIRLYWFEIHRRRDIRPEVADALRLCLLTGQRRVEVAGMKWSELDLDDEDRLWWNLPASGSRSTKAKRFTRVYLPPLARALVHRQREASRVSETYVFPKRTSLQAPLREDDLTESMKLVTDDLLARRLIGARATPHDLRRTATTEWAKTGIANRRLQKLMLNHGTSEVTDRYDRYEYDDEVAEAWSLWAKYLSGKILAPGPVPVATT